MADGRLWEEREARAVNLDKLLSISQVTITKRHLYHISVIIRSAKMES